MVGSGVVSTLGVLSRLLSDPVVVVVTARRVRSGSARFSPTWDVARAIAELLRRARPGGEIEGVLQPARVGAVGEPAGQESAIRRNRLVIHLMGSCGPTGPLQAP